MDKFFAFNSYLNHLFKSKSKFKVHSPFIYDLITKGIVKKIPDSIIQKILSKRKELYRDNTLLEVVDFGAVKKSKSNFKQLNKIAKTALQKQKYAKLLHNLVNYSQSKVIVEFGTSLGLTTSMMAFAAPKGTIYSMEGCKSIAEVAQQNINEFGLKNVSIHIGEFRDVIPQITQNFKKVDFVFFDGNHQKESTIDYFEHFLPYKHNDTIFVFDDIYWSKGMSEAWEYIKNHPDTVVTLDLFQMGVVFFRKELSPQHFIYRF